jgi:predicted benzoate:H+ symporter BenE
MNKAIGVALLAGGIILSIFGFQASDSLSSDISRTFTGSPTDKAVWMIAVGLAAAIAGLVLTLRTSKGPR